MSSQQQPMATFREAPSSLPGVRTFVLDCHHGTTTGDLVNDPRSVVPVLELLVAKHRLEQPTCRCVVVAPGGRA